MLKIFQFLLAAHIPLFLYPFLHTVSKTRPFEYLRLTSLGVIGALVKVSLINIHFYFLYVYLHFPSKPLTPSLPSISACNMPGEIRLF